MSNNNNKGITRYLLDLEYIGELYDYYNNDNYIKKYNNFLKTRIFQLGWVILYKNRFTIKFFENLLFKNYIESFLYECRIYIRLFGFCVYYVVKDISKWMINDSDLLLLNNNNQNFKKPFGFVNIDDINIFIQKDKKEIGNKLIIEPKNKELNRKFNFFIYNYSFKEEKLLISNSNYSKSSCRVVEYLQDNDDNNGLNSNIRPSSQFKELREERIRIDIAKECRGDGNFMSTHPETFVVPEPLKDISLDTIVENNMYSFNDFNEAQSSLNKKTKRILLKDAQESLNQIQNQFRGINGLNNNNSNINKRKSLKKMFNSSDMIDGVQMIPIESAKIYKTHNPINIINIQEELYLYEKLISEIFNLPINLFSINETKTTSSTKKYQQTNQFNNVKIVEKEILNEQNLINQIFIDIFNNSFGLIENIFKKQLSNNNNNNYDNNNNEEMIKNLLNLNELTHILFNSSKIINDEKISLLIPLYQNELLTDKEIKDILKQWI